MKGKGARSLYLQFQTSIKVGQVLHYYISDLPISPGTLVHVGEKKIEKTRIRVIDYDEAGIEESNSCLDSHYSDSLIIYPPPRMFRIISPWPEPPILWRRFLI